MLHDYYGARFTYKALSSAHNKIYQVVKFIENKCHILIDFKE